ncbi:MAG: CBS domain-containing protein [Thermogutta sp.]|nr:CBS domain-containing protein [Thermogutta sp.]
MTALREILVKKGTHVYTVAPDATLQDVVDELVQHNIGAVLVCLRDPAGGEKVLGIVSERDVLRRCAVSDRPLRDWKAEEVMSRNLVTACPDDSVGDVLKTMTVNRIRHLPVLQEGKLVGIVSIGDLVKSQLDELAVENRFMKDYIQS